MLIALLPSEIARLVLNYLDEEKYPKTYDTFLNECRYLEECKIYLKQGISLPRTIHGKKLTEYLVLERSQNEPKFQIKKVTISTQTDLPSLDSTNTTNNNFEPLISNETIAEDIPIESVAKERSELVKGISHLTELIKSNDFEMDMSMGKSSINVRQIKIIASPPAPSPPKNFKSPEIKLIKSPVKKIRIDVKPDIIQLSSDDSDFDITTPPKRRKLLIGKNVQKIPELSVSSLERQLVSIISDATDHLKQQEELEKKMQQQNSNQNSVDILGTISKGPPLNSFQISNQTNKVRQISQISQIGQVNQFSQPIQLSSINQLNQVGQIGQVNQFSQPIQLNSINQLNQISQVANFNNINQLNQIGQVAQVNQIGYSNFMQQGQQVFIVSNPNFAIQKQDQKIIQIPQVTNIPRPQEKESALKTFDANKPKDTNKLIKPKTLKPADPPITIRKSIEEKTSESDPKKKKFYPRHTTTIKSIFESSYNTALNSSPVTSNLNESISSKFTATNNSVVKKTVEQSNAVNNPIIILDNNSLDSPKPVEQINSSSEDQSKLSESRNNDENVSDEIYGLLGISVPNKKCENNEEKSDNVTDFDIEELVKTVTKPPNEQNVKEEIKLDDSISKSKKTLTKRKSMKNDSKLNKTNSSDDLDIVFSETSLNTSTRTLRSRNNSQRRF